jgi:hypothetical protein
MRSKGILLDPNTGRPEGKARVSAEDVLRAFDSSAHVPDRVQALLDKAAEDGWQGPHASSVGWRDVLSKRRVMTSDGAQVLNTTTETIMTPDFTFGADELEAGDLFQYTLFFSLSTVITTPGTVTLRLRWGGVGGVAIATSGAYAPDPTAASTTILGKVVYTMIVRTLGAAGSCLAFGEMNLKDYDDATATTLKGNLDMTLFPDTPVPVSIDTTASKALSPTIQFSVATATTQATTVLAFLESLN